MAAKEKKSSIAKHLKDNQGDKDKVGDVSPKKKRGRKSAQAANEGKLTPDQKKTKGVPGRKRKTIEATDARSGSGQKRARRSAAEQEETASVGKTPPLSGQKFKKAHLEKELGDLLENATGRNTPSLSRNKKATERDDENAEGAEEKSALWLPKGKRANEKEPEDDNVSVKSFSTLLRTRKLAEREIEDDILSVKSMTVKSSRKNDASEDDAASVRSLIRPNLVTKGGRKKKSVLAAIAVKKKIFITRGRPKKNKDASDAKGKLLEEKRLARIKAVDKNQADSKQKRIIKKPLKFQNKLKDQARVRPSLAIKNQKLKKAKLKLSEKHQVNTRQREDAGTAVAADQTNKERLRMDSQAVGVASDSTKGVPADLLLKKKKGAPRKKKRHDIYPLVDNLEKSSDVYVFAEGEITAAVSGSQLLGSRGKSVRVAKANQVKGKPGRKKAVGTPDGKKPSRRESGIHFETTRSPDDSSVIIVQPRLGPKIKGAKRLKPILPKTDDISKRPKQLSKDMVSTAKLLPKPLSTTVPNFNQISNSYFVQSIPNFNVFAANSAIIRSFNSGSGSNFDGSLTVSPADLSYVDDADFSVAALASKMSSNEIIVTPSGIVLSGSRIVSASNQNSSSPAVCFNGSGSGVQSGSSGKEVLYSPREGTENSPGSGLIYQSSTTVIQPQANANAAILLKRPETMSTSLISTSSGAILSITPTTNSNGGIRTNKVKPHSRCNDSTTDTIVSEKALEGDFRSLKETSVTERYKTASKIDFIPSIPVAKNVSDLIMLKNRSANPETRSGADLAGISSDKHNADAGKVQGDKRREKTDANDKRKTRKRILKNVRRIRDSNSELTFSEPECSRYEKDEDEDADTATDGTASSFPLKKIVSCERINRATEPRYPSPKMLLQLGSEPLTISECLAPFETASMLLVAKKEKLEEKLEKDAKIASQFSPKIKGAIEVCRFSKENEEALKELGLDSDLDQTKSEMDADSPTKSTKSEDGGSPLNKSALKGSEKAKIKEEVDNVLKEMPVRRISNFYRKSEPFSTTANRLEFKAPLVHKNGGYLTASPSKPPTVIDKLLERNKSLKKAEQEGKFQNTAIAAFEMSEAKTKKNQRDVRSRKFAGKTVESKRGGHKRFIRGATGEKIYERRGSNPEIFSGNYLNLTNENVPLTCSTDSGEGNFQRRASIDYESIQKVLDRRCSLPVGQADDLSDPKLSKSLDDVNKIKTDNIKTIIVGSSKPLTSKNRTSDSRSRVINIVTSNCGFKKGKNLMEEVGLEMGKSFLNGDDRGRRTSVESSNSESENLQKLMNGLSDLGADDKLSNEVPYFRDKSVKRTDKTRASLEKKTAAASAPAPSPTPVPVDGKDKANAAVEESPEDLVTKETILSALGLQSLKAAAAAAQSAQKKRDVQSQQNANQTDNGGYTGTLKTVIKIQRQEKKGSAKSPIKMVYKASSSSSAGGQAEDSTNNFDEAEATSTEDPEESVSEDNKNGNGKAKSLVIPEKASSFSIHPGRMCSDVCTYCFGKFGLLDTPCHVAQLKDAEKRRNILATEIQLTADSCLCDACFRHVDKRSNCSTFTDKKNDMKRRPIKRATCSVQNCNADSQHSIKRKLFLKLKKSIGRKVVLDAGKLEKLQPGQSLTFCNRHIYWIDYFMSCGICKKRLTSVNMYRVTSEVLELNAALSADEIPAILTENRFLCKICNCFASIRIKCKNPEEMSASHRQFYETCRKRILKCHGMDVPDSEPEGGGESKSGPERRSVRRSKKSSKPTATVTNENSSKSDNDVEMSTEEADKTNESEKELKEVSHMNIPPKANGNLDFGGVSIAPTSTEVNPTQIHVKLGNLNIGALGNLNIGQDVRHGSRPGEMQCFPTEAELSLRAHFDLQPSAEDESAKTPRKGFEKCTTTIQFNSETKNLFYSLQMPYGNQSSFFRHLILLEKYFRSGDLVISRNADPKAVNYISSVQNRIRSYEGVHDPVKKPQDIPPSLSIVPQPIKTETKAAGVSPSRPFTLTPMPSTFLKNSPLSQIQATVQNIQPVVHSQSQGIMTSLLKSSVRPTSPAPAPPPPPPPSSSSCSSTSSSSSCSSSSKFASHPRPEVSITSVSADGPPARIGQPGKPSVLTKKIQENLRNLASKSQTKSQPNQARAVILNRTVAGQKQSLVQVTTGGKTIHLTLSQFRRIQQMQMRKKQYLEHQAKMLKGKDDPGKSRGKVSISAVEDSVALKHLSPELEIQEVVKQQQQQPAKANGSEVFPLISEVRSLAGEDSNWDTRSEAGEPHTAADSFPKIPKTLSVSVTKIPLPDYSVKEQSSVE